MAFDLEKMNKLPREARFFDVNGLWYFFNGWLVRILYPTPITPNQITFLSLVLGLLSAGFYVSGKPDALVWGAVFLYGKVVDAPTGWNPTDSWTWATATRVPDTGSTAALLGTGVAALAFARRRLG